MQIASNYGGMDMRRMGGMGRRGIGGLRGQFNRSRAMGRPAHPTPPPGVNFDLPSRPMGGMMNPMATPGVFKPMGDEINPSAQGYPLGMAQPGYTPAAAGIKWQPQNIGQPAMDRRQELEMQQQRMLAPRPPGQQFQPPRGAVGVPTGPPRQGFMQPIGGPTDQSIYNQGPAPIGDDTFGPVGRLPGYAPQPSPPPPPQQWSPGPQVGPAPFQNISRPLGQPQPLGGPGQQMIGGPQQQGGGQAQGGAKWTMEIKPSEGMATGGMIEEGGVNVPQPRIPEMMTDGVEVLNFDSTAPLPELENPNMPTAADLDPPSMTDLVEVMDLFSAGEGEAQTASAMMEEELLGNRPTSPMGLEMMGEEMMGQEMMTEEMPAGGIMELGLRGGGYIPAYGFGSFLKKGLKGALGIAPLAAMAIPGLGPLASGAIGAGSKMLQSKLSGEGLGTALSRGLSAGMKTYAGRKGLEGFKEGWKGGGSWQDKLEGGFEGLKDKFSMEDILKMAPMIAAEEAMAQGHAGGQATGMGGTTMMPGGGGGGGGGGAGQVGTIMGDTGQTTADVYNLFKKAGGGSLYAMRRFGGGPIKGYQEGGEFGDEFDEPMYRPPPRRSRMRRSSRAAQAEAARKAREFRRARAEAAIRAEEARVAEDMEPALPATIAAMPPPPPPPAPVEAPPENIEPVAPPRIVAPPPPPPAPVAPVAPPMGPDEPDEPVGTTAVPDVPVGTPPLGTLDDRFIDEVEQVLPTTTRLIPETDVSRFGPEVMPEPSEMGEGEGEEGAFTDADPGAYGQAPERSIETTYDMNPYGDIPAEVLSGEREMTQAEIDKRAGKMEKEVERQVEQAQTEAKKELIATNQLDPDDKGEQVDAIGEPDEQEVYKQDDPLGVQATVDSGVTPSGIVDVNTGEVTRNEEYIAAQGPYMGHGYEQPAPPVEAPTMSAPGQGEGLGLFDAPTGQQQPVNMFEGASGFDPFNMPTQASQFRNADPRMEAMLNRLNTDPAPLRKLTPGKAEGGLIQEMQQDELGAQVLSEVMKALQDPEDAQNAETLAGFQEAFGEEALQELVQTLQQGMAAEEQPMAMQTGGLIPGTGDAMADDRFGVVDAGQPDAYPIKFSSGEFIVAGDVVAGLGSGSTDRGAEVLNNLQDDVRVARNGTTQQAPPIDLSEVLPGTYGGKYA